ncbi:MAG TPA: hypothetical protein VFU45_06060 [Gemmatimonadales bacterium]|nr:hypothetical protein [Gemmatimonadales bacterium]
MIRWVAASLLLATACGRGAPAPSRPAPPPRAPAPPDSLALSIAGGTGVWFTFARADTAADGRTCLERTLEIRHADGRRVAVPLLYTGAPPVLLNDSTIRADIWVHCAPTERYRIDLGSGIPTAERRR